MIIVYCDELNFIVATAKQIPNAVYQRSLPEKMLASFKHAEFKLNQRKKGIKDTFKVTWL